jgi:hypothetical protein
MTYSGLMNSIFALCVKLLEDMATYFGTTYEIVNVWIFCIIGPTLLIGMFCVMLIQRSYLLKYKHLWKGATGK